MRLPPLALVLLPLVGACSDPNSLPDATIPNVVDTVTLYALEGTPVATPSAYSVTSSRAVRVDTTAAFDFAYNTDTLPDGSRREIFLPLTTLGITTGASVPPGLQARSEPFDAITQAQSNGYVTDQVVPFAVGDRFVVRSRVASPCQTLGVPQYGKLQVLAVDTAARTVSFQVLTNNNCGYRGLTTGVPEN